MRKLKKGGNFFLVLLFNMFINIEWTIPAWILLALHFFLGWKIMWFWIAIGVWLLDILIWMSILGWASDCSTPTPYRENKNPYSHKSSDIKNDSISKL